jgi:hypothetical protein
MEKAEKAEKQKSPYPHMQPFNVTPRKQKDGKKSIYPKSKKEGK